MEGLAPWVIFLEILMVPVMPVLKPPEILLLINLGLIKFDISGTNFLILLLQFVGKKKNSK